MSKDVRIRGYISKPKGVRELESLENLLLTYTDFNLTSRCVVYIPVYLSSARLFITFLQPSYTATCFDH